MSNRSSILVASLALLLFLSLIKNAYAYLDPGSGSFIFQLVIAALVGALFSVKIFWQKIKDFFKKLFYKKAKR